MKKLLMIAVLLIGLCSVGKADLNIPSTYWEPVVFGRTMKFYIPLMNADIIPFVYGIWGGKGLIGFQTNLVNYGNLKLNFGGAGSEQSKLMPFIGFDLVFAKAESALGDTLSYVGIGFAHDFSNEKNTNIINEILLKATFKFYSF